MHTAIKKTIETEALQSASLVLKGLGPQLDRVEDKLDRVLALLENTDDSAFWAQVAKAFKPAPVQQQQGGGRR